MHRRATPRAGTARGVLARPAWAGLALLLCVRAVSAATGGPDAFGYTWRDGAEPGLTYSFLAPGPAAADVTVYGDDTTTGFLPLSFPFPYYGSSYSQLAICSNGWISLVDEVSTTFTNLRIPTVGEPRGVIAAFWNDLELSDRVSTVSLEDFGTHAVVTWDKAHDRGDSRARNTFQVILHADGRIVVQLDRLDGDTTGASLGIEAPGETTGLQVFRNPAAGVAAPFIVEFAPPPVVGNSLDCVGAPLLPCNGSIAGNRSAGVANQGAYACPTGPMGGREQLYFIDLGVPADLRLSLDDPSGAAQIVVLDGCDPNLCLAPAGSVVELSDFSGSAFVVVDGPAGAEAAYRLFLDCFPVPGRLDCATATPIACGSALSADLRTGSSNQSRYWCTEIELAGREEVYQLDLATPSDVRIDLTVLDGAPRLLLLKPCDPSFCSVPVGNTLQLDDASGSWFVVVDSPAGEEGSYELAVTCLEETFEFCDGSVFDSQAGRDPNGSWSLPGLFHDGIDTHSWALRVDGGTIYTQDESCSPFPLTSAGALGPNGPAIVTWDAPEGRVDVTVSELLTGPCCGLLVTAAVTNTDDRPHAYDLRVLHDLAFGLGDGTCTLEQVDGGRIVVNGSSYMRETELLPLGAALCERPIQLYSAEDPGTLVGSVEMAGPAAPSDMEFVAWANAFNPCAAWSDAQTGENLADCLGDSSLLLTWAFPSGGGQLAPGQTGQAQWRIGRGCTFDCAPACEDVVFEGAVTVSDRDDCSLGVELEWPAASFPDAGNGVHHVYRSTLSAADALLQAPVSPPGGVVGTSWTDLSAPAGEAVYHVVVAESLDLAGCGDGPAVSGATASLSAGPTVDLAAAEPFLSVATASDVAPCAPDLRLDWEAAEFPEGTGVYHVFRSVSSFADALASPALTPAGGIEALSWLDASPPANLPLYYVVQAEGLDRPGCGLGPAVLGPISELEVGPVTDLVAASPTASAGAARDLDACSQGIEVAWSEASFPAGGAGRYHVFRSELSVADALTRAPLTPPEGLLEASWIDSSAPADQLVFYAVLAESTDLPGCGDGPLVGGPTAVIDCGSAQDLMDLERPTVEVGALLRLKDGDLQRVTLQWTGAALPPEGEAWVVLRSGNDAAGGFVVESRPSAASWTDAASAAPVGPSHVFYYDVRVSDDCQLSED